VCPYTVGLCCPTLEQCGETVCSPPPDYPTDPKPTTDYPTEPKPTTDYPTNVTTDTSYPTDVTTDDYPTNVTTDTSYPTNVTTDTSYPTDVTTDDYPTNVTTTDTDYPTNVTTDTSYPTDVTTDDYPTNVTTDTGYPTDVPTDTGYPTDTPTEPPTSPAPIPQVTGYCTFIPVVNDDSEQVLGEFHFLQTPGGTIVDGGLNTGFTPTDAKYTIACDGKDITKEVNPKPRPPGGITPFRFTTKKFSLTVTKPIKGKKCVVKKEGKQIGSCTVKTVE
jgi:hypothetical protein